MPFKTLCMIMPPYDGYQVAQISIPASSTDTEFTFPNLPYLDPKKASIVAMDITTFTTAAIAPAGGSTATAAVYGRGSLTLVGSMPKRDPNTGIIQRDGAGNPLLLRAEGNIVERVPLIRLNVIQNSTPDPFSREYFLLNDAMIDFQKCKVYFPSGPNNGGTAMQLVFGVYYNILK